MVKNNIEFFLTDLAIRTALNRRSYFRESKRPIYIGEVEYLRDEDLHQLYTMCSRYKITPQPFIEAYVKKLYTN